MESFSNDISFNNLTQTPYLDLLEQNEINSIFDTQNINESWINIPFDDEVNMRIYYNNLFQLPTNNNIKELDLNRKFINIKRKGREDKGNTINNKNKINFETGTKKRGRKKVGEIPNEKSKHTKLSDDNKIRKIKGFLLEYILKKLNESIKFSSSRFRPLNKTMKESLKKSENIALLDAYIKDIFSNTKMNKVSEKKGESNKKLIEKIYEENIEMETISILEKTFEEFLNETRDNNLETFLNIIKNKEKRIQNKNNENFDIEKYMKEVKILLFDYKGQFERKKERNKKNKNIENIFV